MSSNELESIGPQQPKAQNHNQGPPDDVQAGGSKTSWQHSNSAFKRGMASVMHAVGFTKGYNFALWFITAGAFFGFTLARFEYLNFNIFCPPDPRGGNGSAGASPGECYWYTNFPRYKVGIILHLATILPAAILVVFQFTPFIRHRFRIYHRIAGYTAVALGSISIAGVFMIAEKAFGGAVTTQAWTGAISIAFLGALGMAVYNIRMKQIEQHRAWMLRAWVWAASIITLRIIMIIGAQVISLYPAYRSIYISYSCNILRYIVSNDDRLNNFYPTCTPVTNDSNTLGDALQVAVRAKFATDRVDQLSASLQACFPMAAWMAWLIHAALLELYLKLTPAEFERLRQISYEKQLEKGFSKPGNAGLTVERLGDARPWLADSQRQNLTQVKRSTRE